jgi:hypothetical protein
LFFKGTCTFKCRSQIKEGDHLALNLSYMFNMYTNLLCSIHSDSEVPVNNEGEGILFQFEGRWQRFPFLDGQGFLLEDVVFVVDWFCKAEKYECQHMFLF